MRRHKRLVILSRPKKHASAPKGDMGVDNVTPSANWNCAGVSLSEKGGRSSIALTLTPRPLGRGLLKGLIVLAVFFALIFSLVYFFQGQYVVPIIMYHSVSPSAETKNMLAVPVRTFERQMQFLKNHHYNVLTLESLENLIREKKKIPARSIAITFDDGYKDNYEYAFPVLKKYGIPATIFIIVNEVGRSQNDRLSWNDILEMQGTGIITIGSHCLGPEPLTKIPSEEQLRREIFDSKKILEEKLKKEVVAFSYPEGRFNENIRQLVIDAGYKLAVATSPGKKFSNNDIFALKRLRISANAGNLFIFWVETSGFYTFMKEHHHGK